MIKIGLVGGAKEYHGMTFAEMFNGYDRKKAEAKNWIALYEARVGNDAQITHIWDDNIDNANEVAQICNIPNVAKNFEDMIGKIDGVIINDDCSLKHQKNAIPFLQARIPTFIDKPLSSDIEEAKAIIRLSQEYKTPLMSCSALRYAKEIAESNIKNIGDIHTGYSICKENMDSFVFYGIHAMELLYTIVGPGIKEIQNVGKKNENIAMIKWKNGKKFIVSAYDKISGVFQASLFGTNGHCTITVQDFDYAYSEMLREFINMIKTGKSPIPLEQTLEIIETIILIENSAQEENSIKQLNNSRN